MTAFKGLPQKHGVSTTGVFLHEYAGRTAIYKYYKTSSKLSREYAAYELLVGCYFVPQVLDCNHEARYIVFEYVGQSLDIKYRPKERHRFLPDIITLNETLIHMYGIYHNDIRWRNIVEHTSGQLYVIDFEKWTFYERHPHDRALCNIGR